MIHPTNKQQRRKLRKLKTNEQKKEEAIERSSRVRKRLVREQLHVQETEDELKAYRTGFVSSNL